MPIYASEAPALDSQASEMAKQNLVNSAKLRELILGHQNKLEEDKQKSALDVGAKQQEQDNAIGAVKKLSDSGMVNDGGSVMVNGVGYGKGYDPNKLARQQQGQQSKEFAALQKTAKVSMGPAQQDLETADMIHRLAENPSSVDMGTAQIMKARMAQGGSGGRALGAALRTMGMDDHTLSGNEQDWANWFGGGAGAKATPQQINAIKEGAFKLGNDASDRLGRAKNQFASQAPIMAPGLASSGTLSTAMPTFSAPADELASKLAQRQKEYLDQAKGAPTGLSPGQAYKEPQGPIDKLRSFLSGSPAPAQSAPQPGIADAVAAEMARRKKK